MKTRQEHCRSEPGDRCLRFRAGLLCCGVVTVFSLYSWRLIHLQYEEHANLRSQQERRQQRTHSLNASRGDILDTRGRILASDEPVQQVSFELDFLKVGAPLAKALSTVEGMKAHDLRHVYSLDDLQKRYLRHLARIAAPFFEMSEADFESRIRARLAQRQTGEVALSRNLSVSATLRLRENMEAAGLGTYRENRNRGTLGGLVFQNAFARRYPAELPLTHIVGFFGETDPLPGAAPLPPRGVAGAERFFDSELTGVPGERKLEVDGWGNEVPAYRGKITPPRNGRGVQLSVDLGLQAIVEKALDETGSAEGEVYVRDLEAERVIVVLFDPATMGVRAIGCRDRIHGPHKPLLNNPVTELLYEPGSTIKIVTVAGALSSGKVHPKSRILLSASGRWDDEDIQPINDEKPMASATVEEILIHSSNIGAYKLGRMLGTRRFEQLFRDFGFCQRTGFESPQESRGYFGGPMTYQTLSRVAFGNAIAVTPAQMCGALGAIINDGQFQPLHLAEAWVDENGHAGDEVVRAGARRIITPGAAEAVRQAMLQVVESGTGKMARSEYFQIAGKTGTARKATPLKLKNGKVISVYQGEVICSFIGFLPADKPKLGGLIIVDNPNSKTIPHYGGRMAAPLFRRIAERAMAYYQVPPQFSPETKLLPQAARSTAVRAAAQSFTR